MKKKVKVKCKWKDHPVVGKCTQCQIVCDGYFADCIGYVPNTQKERRG